jgi:hypothetical protein
LPLPFDLVLQKEPEPMERSLTHSSLDLQHGSHGTDGFPGAPLQRSPVARHVPELVGSDWPGRSMQNLPQPRAGAGAQIFAGLQHFALRTNGRLLVPAQRSLVSVHARFAYPWKNCGAAVVVVARAKSARTTARRERIAIADGCGAQLRVQCGRGLGVGKVRAVPYVPGVECYTVARANEVELHTT